MEYYMMEDRLKRGPFTVEELKARGIRPDTLVQVTGSVMWEKAGNVPELASCFVSPQPESQSYEQAVGQQQYAQQQGQQADQQQQGQQVNQQQQSQHFAGEGQTAQQQYAYNAGQRNAVMPDDYKTMSILMIVFGVIACCCCGVNPIFLIFGIVALSAGNKVLPYFAAGNMVMAEQKSQEAKKMLIWGAIGGSVWLLVYYLVYFLIIMKSQDMDAIMKFYENLLKEMA